MSTFSRLKPNLIWKYFYEITHIPRPSKKEGLIINYLVKFAHNNNLSWKKDKAGNLVIRKPSKQGYQYKETVVLQSHVDMVCEKNEDVEIDFNKESISAYVDGDWVRAKGTSLGADNGIGVAAQLAILADSTLQHGRLECLFTVDEETGMTGAKYINPRLISGSKMINLDSEDEGEIYIGCAGGIDTTATLEFTPLPCPSEMTSLEIRITGLQGGHSGDDINKGRGNAIKILAGMVEQLWGLHEFQISTINGGNLRNAIPREATAKLCLSENNLKALLYDCKVFAESTKKQLILKEPEFEILFNTVASPKTLLPNEAGQQLIAALNKCPNGMIEMSSTMPGLVQTSTNLASVKTEDTCILITTSQRSSIEESKKRIARQVRKTFEAIAARVEHSDPYPGWDPNPDSELLNITVKAHEKLFGAKPKIKAIHAGLECGLLQKKFPNLDIVSFGPTIRGAHSPTERLEIASVGTFWQLLRKVIENIPDRG